MIKKVFMCVSVLSLLLTACSKDEVLDSSKAIGFSTILAPSSRASVFTTTQLQDPANGFRVSAYNQGTELSWNTFSGSLAADPDFMDNTKVIYDATPDPDVWKYTPVKYWPGKVNGNDYGRVTFFAIGGRAKDNMAITYASHLPVFSYTTPAAATAQEDLVAAVKFEQFWSTGKKVGFTFKHILSKIGFTARLAGTYSDATVKVTDLQVVYAAGKVTNSGTYAFDTTKGDSEDADELGSWTSSSTFPSENSRKLFAASEIEVTSTDPANPDVLNDADKFLMLIPQTTTAAGDLTVKLTYTITTGTGPTEQTVAYPVTYQIPASTIYEIGKQYTYNFTLTLNPVEFSTSTTVGDWDENTDIPL